MDQNFDDYSDFQKIPGMPILLQHSVHTFNPKLVNSHEGTKNINNDCVIAETSMNPAPDVSVLPTPEASNMSDSKYCSSKSSLENLHLKQWLLSFMSSI
jgi:hypothetical protein